MVTPSSSTNLKAFSGVPRSLSVAMLAPPYRGNMKACPNAPMKLYSPGERTMSSWRYFICTRMRSPTVMIHRWACRMPLGLPVVPEE